MNTRKIGVVLLALLLAGMAMVPMVSAAGNIKEIDPATAQTVAEKHIKEIAKISPTYADWAAGSVQVSAVYYDLLDRKAAYLFNVETNGAYAGYVLISSSRDNYPVLEFSRGTIPGSQPEALDNAERAVRSSVSDKNVELGAPKLLYLGNTFYYASYPLLDKKGKIIDNSLVDLTDHSVLDVKNLTQNPSLSEKGLMVQENTRVQEANALWDSFEKGKITSGTSATSTPLLTSGSHYIPGVPLYSQPQSNYCAPTSAGMVLSYWDSHGYPNFPNNGVTLINELAGAMLTSPWWGTNIYLVDNGMNSVCSNHGYSYSQLHFQEDSSMTFSEVTGEVNSNRPFVLNMLGGGTAYGRSQPYGDHSVAVMGYESYPGGNYVVVQDTWTPLTSVSLSYGNWRSALADYSRPR